MEKIYTKIGSAVTSVALCLSLTPVVFAGGGDYTSFSNNVPASISVTGEGKVTVQADKAVISVTIENTEPSARAARQKNNQIYSDLKSALQTFGIDDKSIHIDYNSGYANYDVNDNNVRKVSNYTSTYSVSIQIKDLSKLDAITDRLSDFDTVNFQNTNFLLEDNEKATDQAREKAAENAAKKAKKLADLYHVTLGPIYSINETSYSGMPYSPVTGQTSSNSVEVNTSLFVNYSITK